ITERLIALPLAKFTLFRKYLKDHIKSALSQPWASDLPRIDNRFLDSIFYRSDLTEFFQGYDDWLSELQNNRRGFSPFNLNSSSLESLVNGKSIKSGLFSKKVDYAYIDGQLNKESNRKSYPSAP